MKRIKINKEETAYYAFATLIFVIILIYSRAGLWNEFINNPTSSTVLLVSVIRILELRVIKKFELEEDGYVSIVVNTISKIVLAFTVYISTAVKLTDEVPGNEIILNIVILITMLQMTEYIFTGIKQWKYRKHKVVIEFESFKEWFN